MYHYFLPKGFSRKRIRQGALICLLITVLFFCASFKTYLDALPTVKEFVTKRTHAELICNTDEERTEFCEINTVARVDAKSSSILVVPTEQGDTSFNITIRPYARKEDPLAMGKIRKWSVMAKKAAEDPQKIPPCTQNHSVPALLFSLSGYKWNNFHQFSEVVIPLFITSKHYNGVVQFLITDYFSNSVDKFQKILGTLSKYKPIAIDNEDQQVHCFPSLAIGLKRDTRDMSIDPEKHSTSMKEFREFLRNTYSLSKTKAMAIKDNLPHKKPQLLILSRQKTRTFTNIREIMAMATSLGYQVTVTDADWNLARTANIMNSCDVFVGVYGAGLANIVFLPEKAVFIQIVPIGLVRLAQVDFALPSKAMNLRNLDYKISKEESTLIEKYPINHTVFSDPYSINGRDFRKIYLLNQNVNLNVTRFRPTLVKALQLLRVHR